jgi:glucose-1-phosphate thymidylyltransferase
LLIGEVFLAGSPVCLVLGDNLLFGHNLVEELTESTRLKSGARVFAYQVQDPERYGVVQFDASGRALRLEEKPKKPFSNWAVVGLYFYDSRAVELAKTLAPSARGELEITDLNRKYLDKGQLVVTPLGRGIAWLDVGTHDTLLTASSFVQALEQRQGLKIACLEEIALTEEYIDAQQFEQLAAAYGSSPYGHYLQRVKADYQAAQGSDRPGLSY